MKPQTQNMDVKLPEGGTKPNETGVVHGRVRFGRFLLGSAALVGMVAVAMFTGSGDLNKTPLLGVPEQITTASHNGGGDLNDPAGPGAAPAPAQPGRIGGSGATNTAIAISQRAFPTGATEVYVARLDNPVDALAASVLPSGPILLAPSTGNVPSAVFEEIKRLNPNKVVVLGGTGAIDSYVESQLGTYTGKPVSRIYGSNRVTTAAEIAKYAYPNGNPVVYLADAIGSNGKGSPDSVSGGVLKDGPIITVSTNGSDIATAAQTVKQLGANQVIALGGTSVVSDTTLNQVAGGVSTARLAGSDRYQTSQAIAKHAFPGGASQVYLAPGKDLTYALIAGSLSDGPTVLVPADADTNTRSYVTSFGNPYVAAIGDASVISDNVMQVAAGYAQPAQQQVKIAAAAPVAGVSQVYTHYSMQPSPADAAREDAVYNSINAIRNSKGVPSLQRHAVMDDAARAWAQQVARTDVFEHSSGALKYADLFPAGWRLAGENMVGYYNIEPGPYAQGASQLWVNSPGHYTNLIDRRFTHTGIGVATGRTWVYAVQNFGQY